MKELTHRQHHSLYHALRLLESATVFTFLLMLLVLGLFLLGNYQEFLDSSQNMLLGVLRTASLASALVGIYYFVALVVWMLRRRHSLPLRVVFSVVVVGLRLVLAFGSDLVVSFLSPTAGA